MSKSSELDQAVKCYLINAIDLSGYDINADQLDTKGKLAALDNIFYNEVGSYLIPKVGKQQAIREWLSGLPSSIKIACYNNDILDLAVSWGSIPEDYSEDQAFKILDNYFNLLAAKLLQLFNGYHVPKV